jgi:pilus assembly protein Flp/PilA
MLDVLKDLIQDENGQGMVEYGLVLGVLATGVILFILALRYSVQDLVYEIVTRISNEISNIISV